MVVIDVRSTEHSVSENKGLGTPQSHDGISLEIKRRENKKPDIESRAPEERTILIRSPCCFKLEVVSRSEAKMLQPQSDTADTADAGVSAPPLQSLMRRKKMNSTVSGQGQQMPLACIRNRRRGQGWEPGRPGRLRKNWGGPPYKHQEGGLKGIFSPLRFCVPWMNGWARRFRRQAWHGVDMFVDRCGS